MAETIQVREGGCRCGRVRFRVTAEPVISVACHCRGCQRMTASAFSLSVCFPPEALEVTQGEPERGGLHDPGADHRHCAWCKSWVFTRSANVPYVNVRTTALDDPSGLEPFAEMQTAEKLPWATTSAEHSYERWPKEEAFGELIAAYAKVRAELSAPQRNV